MQRYSLLCADAETVGVYSSSDHGRKARDVLFDIRNLVGTECARDQWGLSCTRRFGQACFQASGYSEILD